MNLEYLRKNFRYILKLCRDITQNLEETLRGGKLVKNLEIF